MPRCVSGLSLYHGATTRACFEPAAPPPPAPALGAGYQSGGAAGVVETLSGSISGYQTLRLRIDLPAEQNLYAIFSKPGAEMVIPPAYQVPAPFGSNIGGVDAALVGVEPTAQYDSWLSVGLTEGNGSGQLTSIGVDFDGWTETSALPVQAGLVGAAVLWLDPAAGPSGSAVVAQLTLPSGGTGSATMGAQGRTSAGADQDYGTGDDWQDFVQWGWGQRRLQGGAESEGVVACPRTFTCGDDEGLDARCTALEYEFTGDLPDEIFSFGFDSARNAMTTIFIATSGDEWPQLADPLRASGLTANGTVWTFFALIVLICGMLGTNLFVAVVTFAFANVAQEESGGSAFEKESRLEKLKRLSHRSSSSRNDEDGPSEKTQVPNIPRLSPLFRRIVNTSWFESGVLTVVILNTAALGSDYYDPVYHHVGGMDPSFRDQLDWAEAIFTTVYCVEMGEYSDGLPQPSRHAVVSRRPLLPTVMKWVGLGFREYFSSGFNCLDCTLVWTTLISYAVKDLKGFGAGRMFRIMRLFRAARLIRLLRKYDSIRRLLRTVTTSWTALLNVGFFIVVWLVIFAVMGIHLYGFDAEKFVEDGLPRDNFHDFPRSFLTCFIILTGEDWSPLMFAYIRAYGWNAAIFFIALFVMANV